jgi:hypothetical protein
MQVWGLADKLTVGSVAISAVLGGTVEVLGGGKFSNGAISGAYIMLLNHMTAHSQNSNYMEIEDESLSSQDRPVSIDWHKATDAERNNHIVYMLEYGENRGSTVINIHDFFTNLPSVADNTDHRKPTLVNFMGVDTYISVAIRLNNDGRILLETRRFGHLHDRQKWEYFHPDSLLPKNRRLNTPVIMIFDHYQYQGL